MFPREQVRDVEGFKNKKPDELWVEVGGHNNGHPGYENNDIADIPEVKHVAPAWNLKHYKDNSVDKLISDHSFEHLTYGQALVALKEWYRIMKVGGIVEIRVPNIDGHFQQYYDVMTKEPNNREKLDHAMAGFYGWQRPLEGSILEEAPTKENSTSTSYFSQTITNWGLSDSHKWGWNFARLKVELEKVGFKDIKKIPRDPEHRHFGYDLFLDVLCTK